MADSDFFPAEGETWDEFREGEKGEVEREGNDPFALDDEGEANGPLNFDHQG